MKEIYSNEQNITRVVDLYEKLFSLREEDRSLPDNYAELKRTLDELDFYQSLVMDLEVLELALVKFLSE